MTNEERLAIQTTLNNLSGYALYDSVAYRLSKREADICIAALRHQLKDIDKHETTV